jgi:hypothetical protein
MRNLFDNKFSFPIKMKSVAIVVNLTNRLLKEKLPKGWFRAFFNLGLISYIQGNKCLLPCEDKTVNFLIDPWGEVLLCNALEPRYWQESMGSIRKSSTFEEIWFSEQANHPRSCTHMP